MGSSKCAAPMASLRCHSVCRFRGRDGRDPGSHAMELWLSLLSVACIAGAGLVDLSCGPQRLARRTLGDLFGDRDKSADQRLVIRPPLHPKGLVFTVAGAEQVVILESILLRQQAFDRSYRTFAQLSGTGKSRLDREVEQRHLFDSLNLHATLACGFPHVGEGDEDAVACVDWLDAILVRGRDPTQQVSALRARCYALLHVIETRSRAAGENDDQRRRVIERAVEEGQEKFVRPRFAGLCVALIDQAEDALADLERHLSERSPELRLLTSREIDLAIHSVLQ